MKRIFPLAVAILLCLSLVGCGNHPRPIDGCVWKFQEALEVFSQQSHLFAVSAERAGEEPAEGVKYINCTLRAGDGKFSITDKTNSLTYTGTYRLLDIQPLTTNYTISINGAEGLAASGSLYHADGTETKTLVITIAGYTLNFHEIK